MGWLNPCPYPRLQLPSQHKKRRVRAGLEQTGLTYIPKAASELILKDLCVTQVRGGVKLRAQDNCREDIATATQPLNLFEISELKSVLSFRR